MGKDKFPYVSLTASFLAMLALLVLTVRELISYIEIAAMEELENLAHEEYCGSYAPMVFLAMFYPIIAICGLTTSWYCGVNTRITWVRRASFIMLGVCLVVLLPFCAALLGWTDPGWAIIQVAKWFENLFI